MDITCISHRPTKDQAAKLLGIKTYDCALPQPWLDAVVDGLKSEVPEEQDLYGMLLTSIVWSYDQAKIFGGPHPLTVQAYGLLKKFDDLKGSHFVDELDGQINVLQIEE